jgi:hypothetical protein
MSHLDGRVIRVKCDDDGIPVRLGLPGKRVLSVLAVRDHWREWFDSLRLSDPPEPERDVWQLETDAGHVEIHGLREPPDETAYAWILHRWED